MCFLVYVIFMCELQNVFFLRDMMDNQCANIFSTHVTVYGSRSVKFAYIERENIFLQVNPHFFQYGLCLFIYPHLLNFPLNCFSQNLFCFSYFYRGRNLFNFCGSQQELLLFIGGVVSIFIELNCFLFPWFSFFSHVYCHSTLCLSCLCQFVTKMGRNK